MGYRPRPDFPDAVHHVFARGNNKQAIFRDDLDRLGFLSELSTLIEEYEWALYAWCLMGNHFHLLLQTPDASLSTGMQKLLNRYASRFNMRYKRNCHVFKSRFDSVLVESDEQFKNVFRYVLRNPVEAGLTERVQDWRWSSYTATMTGQSSKLPIALKKLLPKFDCDAHFARMKIAECVNESPFIADLQFDRVAGAK